jgi:hypothetical protein
MVLRRRTRQNTWKMRKVWEQLTSIPSSMSIGRNTGIYTARLTPVPKASGADITAVSVAVVR